MILNYFVVFLVLINVVLSQRSPCPDVLKYEDRTEQDRIYGVLMLQTQEELTGIWIHVILDRKAELLGNWFGEATSTDNKEYIIRNKDYKLEAGPPVSVRFFIKYNPASVVPTVQEIRLNGRTICTSGRKRPSQQITERPLFISNTERTRRTTTSTSTTTTRVPYDVIPSGLLLPSHPNPDDYVAAFPNRAPGPSFGQQDYRPTTTTEPFYKGDLPPNFSVVDNLTPVIDEINRLGQEQCGKVARLPVGLIYNGQNTTQGQWPWHVALYYSGGIQLMYTCGGTLISKRHVVTAAHCVTRPGTARPINADNLIIYLGKYNLIKFGTEVQDREALEIKVHPEYDAQKFYNDIALIVLSKPAQYTTYVRAACLWSGSIELNHIENKVGTVVGWGFDEHKRISNTLMQAGMPVVSADKCIFSNREFFSQFLFDKNYCAGFRNGTSVCNGDSGGGMVFPRSGTSGQDTVWEIRGLVSVGVAQQTQSICDPKHYIVFTDVAKHLDWIKRIINRD